MMLIFWSLIAYTKPTTNMKSLSQEARVLGVTLHNLMLKTENIVFTCSRLNHFSNDLFMKNLSRWCVVLSDPFNFTKKKMSRCDMGVWKLVFVIQIFTIFLILQKHNALFAFFAKKKILHLAQSLLTIVSHNITISITQ